MPMPLSGLALTLSAAVKDVQTQIVDVQNQLSSGKKTLNPAEDGIVTRLSAQAQAYGTVNQNIAAAQNVINVSQTALSSIATILTQMKSLATQASSAGLNSNDLASLNTTFTSLRTQVTGLVTAASINGNNLLDESTGISVTTGIRGASTDSTAVTGLGLTAGVIANIASLKLIGTQTSVTPASAITTTYAAAVVSSSTAEVKQVDTVTFANNLAVGDTVNVGGLIFTANGDITSSALATEIAARINSATYVSTYGTFSGTAPATTSSATSSSNTVLLVRSGSAAAAVTTTASTATTVLGATNAASAIGTLTTQLTTVSTGQSSLSASATGLTAKSKAVEALQNGLQNTVDTIQNIDATAMQARLQQLNNQQSIDYYLVSQMNTEAAAILSIFR